MLERMKMARSVFYYHIRRLNETDGYDDVRRSIMEIYDQNHGRYGYRRITAQLRNEGIEINHKLVQRLMLQIHLKAKRRRQQIGRAHV